MSLIARMICSTRTATAVGYLVLATLSSAQDLTETANTSVKQFYSGKVIGHLGHPLGTIVRVTGVCIDGDKTRRKADLGKTLLEIRIVNGSKLEHPFVVQFSRAAKDVLKPKDGDSFDYFAHEWGEFDGIVTIPDGLGIDRPIVANDGFYYRPQITIHKSNAMIDGSPLQRK